MPVDAPLYPVSLVVRGRSCLVVGGGRIAAGKVRQLVACGALVHVIAPEVDAAIASEPGVAIERRRYERGDVAGHRLVFTATADPDGQPGRARRRRGGRHLGQQRRRSRQLLVHAARRRPARPGHHRGVHRRPQPGPGHVAAPSFRGRARARVRGARRPARRRAGRRSGPTGGPPRASTGSRALDSGMLDLHPGRPGPGGKGALAGVSVVVVGLNQRTVPLELLERHDGERRAPAQGARRPARAATTSPRPCVLSTCHAHRGLRGGRALPRRRRRTSATSSPNSASRRPRTSPTTSTRSTTRPPSPTSSGSPAVSTRPCSARARSSARSAGAWQRAIDEGARPALLGTVFRHALEVGKRARAETAIARGTTSVSQAAVEMAAQRRRAAGSGGWHSSPSARSSCSARATWARAWSPRSPPAAPARSSSPTAARRRRPALATQGRRPLGGPRRARRRAGRRRRAAHLDRLARLPGRRRGLHCRDAGARRTAAAGRRHRRAARRRPVGARARRRHAARHGRPRRVRRGRHRRPPPRGHKRRGDHRRRGRALTSPRSPRARPRRSSPRCTSRAEAIAPRRARPGRGPARASSEARRRRRGHPRT